MPSPGLRAEVWRIPRCACRSRDARRLTSDDRAVVGQQRIGAVQADKRLGDHARVDRRPGRRAITQTTRLPRFHVQHWHDARSPSPTRHDPARSAALCVHARPQRTLVTPTSALRHSPPVLVITNARPAPSAMFSIVGRPGRSRAKRERDDRPRQQDDRTHRKKLQSVQEPSTRERRPRSEHSGAGASVVHPLHATT